MADDKTFTQAEMDSIIEGRLARERQKYADYDDLKEKQRRHIQDDFYRIAECGSPEKCLRR